MAYCLFHMWRKSTFLKPTRYEQMSWVTFRAQLPPLTYCVEIITQFLRSRQNIISECCSSESKYLVGFYFPSQVIERLDKKSNWSSFATEGTNLCWMQNNMLSSEILFSEFLNPFKTFYAIYEHDFHTKTAITNAIDVPMLLCDIHLLNFAFQNSFKEVNICSVS